jgi:hypothetical protein
MTPPTAPSLRPVEAPPDRAALKSELQRLRHEHGELKARLSELNSRLYLSSDDEVERKTIQKLKLRTKDRIAALERALDSGDG